MPDQLSLALHGRVLRSNVPRVMDLKNVSTMQCLTGDLQSKSAERGIVVIIFFPTHPLPGSGLVANHERGDFEAVLGQALLIRVGTILRAAIRLMNAAFGRLAQCHSHVQRPDSEIAFHRLLTIAQQGHAKHDPERGGPPITRRDTGQG